MKYKMNLNRYIYVKLTTYGKGRIIEDWGYGYFEHCIESNKQPDGYYKLQMHQVMHLLGKYCYNGCKLPLELAVYFDDDSIEVEK